MEFDSVQIGAPDVSGASRAYEQLLGIAPTRGESGAVRFQLRRGAVEIKPGAAGLYGIRFCIAPNAEALPADFHGLHVSCTIAAPPPAGAPATGSIEAIDHIVIHSPNLDRAIALWRDRLGLRLALDREFPARGLRIVFFRSAGVTLEFVGALTPAPDAKAPDVFNGIAYRVGSLELCRERLLRAQLDVSPIRSGQKAGTLVATVRSAPEGVPTLLIEDPSRTG